MRAVRRPASKATAPACPRSSPQVRTRSTSRCGRLCCVIVRTASSSAATLALLSAPSTVRPSVLMTPSRSTGLTPRPGSTVSVWAHSMIGGRSGREPGKRTCRLPAPSRPVRSLLDGRPSASSSAASRSMMARSSYVTESICTSARNDCTSRSVSTAITRVLLLWDGCAARRRREGQDRDEDDSPDSHASSRISASACSSQNRMSISRYIVVAVVRCSGPARACRCAGRACRGRGGTTGAEIPRIPSRPPRRISRDRPARRRNRARRCASACPEDSC